MACGLHSGGYPMTPDARTLALAALYESINDHNECVHDLMVNLLDTYGAKGMIDALIAWADSTALLTGVAGAGEIELAYRLVGDSDTDVTPEEVPHGPRWAGRWIAARACNDLGTGRALLATMGDPMECLAATLLVATETIKAEMQRSSRI